MRTFNDFMNAKLKVRLEDDSLRKLKIQEDKWITRLGTKAPTGLNVGCSEVHGPNYL